MGEFPTLPLRDLALMLSGGTPSKLEPAYWDGDIPWLSPKDMAQWGGVTEKTVTERAIGHGTRLAASGAIFVAVRGMSLHDEIRIVRSNTRMTFNQDIKAIVPHKGTDGFFIYYSLLAKRDELLNAVEAAGHGTGRLPTDRLQALAIPNIPLAEQRAIASILSALDDKIELNRRMNETLEALAREIFKSWFVDFDPVRAKAEGRRPFGMDDPTAALFPDRFGPDGLPEAWREATISEIAEVNAWTLRSSDELEQIEYIEISCVDRGQINEITWYRRGEEPSRARRRLRHGDTALSTVRPERRAYFLALNPSPSLIASTGFAVVTPKAAPWSFVHVALTMPEVFDELGHLADGAAYPAVRPEVVASISTTRPDDPRVFKAYHALASPLLELAHSNRRANDTLAALRDLLLPKLMSGEIRVKGAERSMEDSH